MTRTEYPVPEPKNKDSTHRPPTKRDATINPKYGFQETFVRVKFTGTIGKMLYIWPNGRAVNRKKTQRKRKLSQSRHSRPTIPIGPRVLGGPSTNFLRRYRLNEKSHPMNWVTAFIPLTPDATWRIRPSPP